MCVDCDCESSLNQSAAVLRFLPSYFSFEVAAAAAAAAAGASTCLCLLRHVDVLTDGRPDDRTDGRPAVPCHVYTDDATVSSSSSLAIYRPRYTMRVYSSSNGQQLTAVQQRLMKADIGIERHCLNIQSIMATEAAAAAVSFTSSP